MMTGIRLMIYLGVAFLLLGVYIIISDALGLTPTVISAFGVFLCAIGITIAFVGFLGKDGESPASEITEKTILEGQGGDPMSHLKVAATVSVEKTKKFRGNRAIGFVLMFVGVIVIAPLIIISTVLSCCNWPDIGSFFGQLGLMLSSPISILGMICLSFGLMFRKLSFH